MPLQATSGAASYDAFGGGVAAVPNYIEDVFSTYLYTGNGTTGQTINNGIDLTEGGLVVFKNRADASWDWIDTERGGNNSLRSNSTGAQYVGSSTEGVTAFNSNGFTLGANIYSCNGTSQSIASWSWAKAPKFFDVVTYTGDATSNRQIAHNLGSVPGCIIIKSTSDAYNWMVYHTSLGANADLRLNLTNAAAYGNGFWENTSPTSTNFTIGSLAAVNTNGATYVAYLFAHDAGGFGLTGTDNVISCGSFSGNTTVDLGYEPQWVLLKNATSADNWYLIDNMRGWPVQGNGSANTLYANSSVAEQTGDTKGTPTATGFTTYGFGGSTGIYIAIRRGPMKVPTSGTSVFAPALGTSASTIPTFVTNFPVDLGFYHSRANTADWFLSSRLQGGGTLNTNTTLAEAAPDANYAFDSNTGWGKNFNSDKASSNFRRAPSFFDEVCYTGNNTAGRQINHNLGVSGELIIIKSRSSGGTSWRVWASSINKNMMLELTIAAFTSTSFIRSSDSTTFTVGADGDVNGSSATTYVAYLFATCAGVSKVFSYTGNGSSKTIDCGFTGGARFVLIKRTDSTGDWYVWDTARNIVSGNDPHLSLNSTAAEVTTDDTIDTDTTGFIVNQVSATNVNVTDATYIGLAIA